MNADLKRVTSGQVYGVKLAGRVALMPFRVHWDREHGYMIKVMGFAKTYAWARFWVRVVPAVVFILFLVWAWFVLGTVLFVLAWLATNEVAGRGYKGITRPRTTTRRGLAKFMVEEALVKVNEGERPPKLTILSSTEDEHGKTMRVRAPVSSTVDMWAKKSDLIANRAGVPSALCEVVDDADAAPNTFFIWIGKAGGRRTRRATVPSACDFHEPFRVGVAVNGAPTLAETFEHNTLIGGIPGMGKTSTVRAFILRCLRDPDGHVFLVDGKGSRKDYADGRHCYSAYVNGSDDDALGQVERLLEHIHGEVNRLNGEDGRCKYLLVLDEWQDIRAGADADTLKRIDTLMHRIHKKGRATGLHIILATQRCSALAIPTELRSLFRQAIGFRQKNSTDYGMVLGNKPDDGVTVPARPGEAILSGDTGQRFVLLDHLTDDMWTETVRTVPGRDHLDLSSPDDADPLVHAIRTVARTMDEDRIRPDELWDRLPDDVRPANAAWLGRTLAQHGVEVRTSAGRTYDRKALLEVA